MIAQILTDLRKNNSLTQKQMADKLGMSVTGYAGWEQGRTEPDIAVLKRMADIFDCSIDYLVGREEIDGTLKKPVASAQPKQNNDEKEMIDLYRQLGRDFQNQTKGFMIRLIEEQQRIDWLKKKA